MAYILNTGSAQNLTPSPSSLRKKNYYGEKIRETSNSENVVLTHIVKCRLEVDEIEF